jgi:hypothetical protein
MSFVNGLFYINDDVIVVLKLLKLFLGAFEVELWNITVFESEPVAELLRGIRKFLTKFVDEIKE